MGQGAYLSRLLELRDFLSQHSENKQIQVVIHPVLPGINLTILGDWFVAEANSSSWIGGLKQTTFCTNLSMVQNRIDYFDHEFEKYGKDPINQSTATVIGEIERIIATLGKQKSRHKDSS